MEEQVVSLKAASYFEPPRCSTFDVHLNVKFKWAVSPGAPLRSTEFNSGYQFLYVCTLQRRHSSFLRGFYPAALPLGEKAGLVD